jgi:hypothetical protein
MWQISNQQWWALVIVSLIIVGFWPPRDDKSLALKFVNWAVDPRDELPVLPNQLPLGQGDNYEAVEAHDRLVQQYDALYSEGGWTRRRLELKVATDPLNPAIERQLLVALGLVSALIVWRRTWTRAR